MAIKQLGVLAAVDLREVWRDEARDFTPWLAKPDNLVLLSQALGDVELELEDVEVSVGPFKSDIVATDIITKGRVVIENQLEKTNHDHLGKIITYASGLDAKIIVWIASEFTEEHRQAIDFLNEQAAPDLRIYGIEMKLFRIGNSEPAADFHIIARPNEYVASLKGEKRAMTETKVLYRNFWSDFKAYCEKNGTNLSLMKPPSQNWYPIAIGKAGCFLSATATVMHSRIGCELYLGGPTAKQAFKVLQADKAAIEKELGALEWQELPEGQDSRIVVYKPGVKLEDKDNWPIAFDWLRTKAEAFSRVLGPRVKALKLVA